MKTIYDFKSTLIKEPIICDNCGKTITPRLDTCFKDSTYGVVFCLDCRTEYLKNLEKN